MIAEYELPWPPSVNHYYRHVGPRVLISKDGRMYREIVVSKFRHEGITKYIGAVELHVELYPPDRRRRDVDNSLKSLLDTFTHAGLYDDDSQIRKLTVIKQDPLPPDGLVYIRIKDYDEQEEKRTALPAGSCFSRNCPG